MGFFDIFKKKEDVKLEKIMKLEDEMTLLHNEVKNMGVRLSNLEKRVFANEMIERRKEAKENEEKATQELIDVLSSLSSDGKIDTGKVISFILSNPSILKEILKRLK